MKTFKYFHISDTKKEAIGFITANNISEAFTKASMKKKLSLKKFKVLFGIEQGK